MFRKVKKLLDRSLELLVTVSMGVLVVDVVWQVFTRYILRDPSSWTEELATFLMIWVGMLGASVALNRGAHLGIDYFVSKLSPKKGLYAALFVFAVISVFALLVLIVGGIQLVIRILATQQVSPALGLKMGYVYLAVPISGFFLVFYSLELFAETVLALSKGQIIEEPHDFESGVGMD
jgi:TRAP-type C4-dicarboxylate transport system permease small subunit